MTSVLSTIATEGYLQSSNHRHLLNSSRLSIGTKRSGLHAGCLPCPARRARSWRRLAAQAEEIEREAAEHAPRAPDPGEIQGIPGRALKAERAAVAERSPGPQGQAFSGVRGQPCTTSGRGVTLRTHPSAGHPSAPKRSPGSQNLRTREAGSPTLNDVSDAATATVRGGARELGPRVRVLTTPTTERRLGTQTYPEPKGTENPRLATCFTEP